MKDHSPPSTAAATTMQARTVHPMIAAEELRIACRVRGSCSAAACSEASLQGRPFRLTSPATKAPPARGAHHPPMQRVRLNHERMQEIQEREGWTFCGLMRGLSIPSSSGCDNPGSLFFSSLKTNILIGCLKVVGNQERPPPQNRKSN